MNQQEIEQTVAEMERRWRNRTPVTNILDANASNRVVMSEIILWGKQNNIKVDRFDENLQIAATKLFFKLRKEYPNDNWEYLNSATRQFCKKHKIPVPRGTR